MPKTQLNGSCQCGSIRYEINGEIAHFYHCHCGRCRKASGTGHATNIMIKSDGLIWLSGEELLRRYKIPDAERFTTCFCSQCGSPMPRFVAARGITVIPAGSLDSDPGITPHARIFWGSRTQWSCVAGDLPIFTGYPAER